MRKARQVVKQLPTENTVEAKPITLLEISELQAGLRLGTLAWQDVHNRVLATVRVGRMWQTKEWKARRAELIKNACEQCGSTKGPFTLQHFKRPGSIFDVVNQAVGPVRWAEWESHYAVEPEDKTPITRRRQACPQCRGISILERKTKTPRFRCTSRVKGVCNFEFDDPVEVDWVDARATAARVNGAYHRRRKAFNEKWDADHADEIEQLYVTAVIRLLDDYARYMRMDDTATFCKPCAYLWDVRGVRQCSECRVSYHPHGQDKCAECAGVVTMVVCKVCRKQRHNARYETCYDCRPSEHDDATDLID
jgi:hypothetical protein